MRRNGVFHARETREKVRRVFFHFFSPSSFFLRSTFFFFFLFFLSLSVRMSAAFVAEVGAFCAAARRRQLRGPAACARRAAELLRLLVANGRHADPCSLIADVRKWGAEMQAAAPLGEEEELVVVVQWGSSSYRFRIALLDWSMRRRGARKGRPGDVFLSTKSFTAAMRFRFFLGSRSRPLLPKNFNTLPKKHRALHRQHGAPRPPHDPRGERRRVQRRDRRG